MADQEEDQERDTKLSLQHQGDHHTAKIVVDPATLYASCKRLNVLFSYSRTGGMLVVAE